MFTEHYICIIFFGKEMVTAYVGVKIHVILLSIKTTLSLFSQFALLCVHVFILGKA